MNFSLDYVYFRLQQFYFKWDGRNGITAVIGVSMIQVLTAADIVFCIIRLCYSRQEISPYSKILSSIFVIILLIVVIYNHYKYKNKYNSFKKRWKDESHRQRIIKGILVIVSLILPMLPLIIMGIL